MAEAALYTGTGRRKTAVARVRLLPGDGKITVNGRDLAEFFPRPAYQMAVKSPLETLGAATRYDVVAKIEGGGLTGQAEAPRHGIARAAAEGAPAGRRGRPGRAVRRRRHDGGRRPSRPVRGPASRHRAGAS